MRAWTFCEGSYPEMSKMRRLMQIVSENAQEEAYVREVPVTLLARVWNPFERSPWPEVKVITKDDVRAALEDQRLNGERYDDVMHTYRAGHTSEDRAKTYHVERIAHLVQHPSSDPLSVLENELGGWDLEDGYHRLAAAIYRQTETITVRTGAMDEFVRWLSYEGD